MEEIEADLYAIAVRRSALLDSIVAGCNALDFSQVRRAEAALRSLAGEEAVIRGKMRAGVQEPSCGDVRGLAAWLSQR